MLPLPIALAGYPPVLLRLVGEEAARACVVETRASCQRCPMRTLPGEDPLGERSFAAQTCCTYHPSLPSFLVGQALDAGGAGASLMRERLTHLAGLHNQGVDPPIAWREAYARPDVFGMDPTLLCPYLTHVDQGCAIHPSRGAVCRTWHCRYDQGQRGREVWMALCSVLLAAESAIAMACTAVVPHPWPLAKSSTWERYYLDCAEVAAGLEPGDLAHLTHLVEGPLTGLRIALSRRSRHMPERLRTCSHQVEPAVHGVWQVVGYSKWDPIAAPSRVLTLLGALHSGGSWRQAAAEAQVEPAMVRALWRAEVLVDADG